MLCVEVGRVDFKVGDVAVECGGIWRGVGDVAKLGVEVGGFGGDGVSIDFDDVGIKLGGDAFVGFGLEERLGVCVIIGVELLSSVNLFH